MKIKKEIVNFLSDLIKFKTTADNKEELERCAKFIVKKAENLGLEAEIVYGEVPNVLIKKPGKGKKVTFVTHFDVVPAGKGWETNPFEPVIKNGKIYGRGASDDKGHLATAFFALADTEDLKINPTLAIAGGEETQKSVDFFEKVAKNTELAIVLDTGPLEEIQIGSSGFLGYWLKIKGKQGHSAYESAFENPILKLDKVLKKINEIKDYALENFKSKLSGKGYEEGVPLRINPTIIESVPKTINIVPKEVKIYINLRTVPEYDNKFATDYLLKELSRFDNFLEIEKDDLELDPWMSKAEEIDIFKKYVQKIIKKEPKIALMPGGSDGIHFYKKGCKVIEYGFSKLEHNIHGSNENVKIGDLVNLYEILKQVVSKGI
jgi:succinyl-diaminopimelate desuccinylase